VNVSVHPDKLYKPVSSSLLPAMAQTDGTRLHASTVMTPTAGVDGSDSSLPTEGQHDQILSLLQSLPLDLLAEQCAHAEASIRSRVEVFSRSEYDIGRTNIIPHRINTGDHSPHFEQLWCHRMVQLLVIDKHVQHMLDHDVIEPVALPWCSNVVMVRKQDGTMQTQ